MFNRQQGAARSSEAVREGLDAVYPKVWRYALALTGARDRADDLAQAACLRALEKSASYEPGTHLDRWLLRIAQRIWFNELRKNTVRRGQGLVAVEDADLADPRPGPETNILTREVLEGIMDLPEAQRTTVMLVYGEGYAYREAAEIMEVPIGTIMSRLAAARGKLSATFGSEGAGA